MVPAVLERDDVAVVRRAEDFQDLAAKDPVVPVENARARFNDEAAHGRTDGPGDFSGKQEVRFALTRRRTAATPVAFR